MVVVLRLRRRGFRMQIDLRAIVHAVDDDDAEGIVSSNAGLGSPRKLLDLVDRDFDRFRLSVRAPVGISSTVLLVEVGTEERLGDIDHHEPRRDRRIVGSVDGLMARVQLVVETRKCALMRRHARLGFESYEHIADGHLVKDRQATEFFLLGRRQVDPIVVAEVAERSPRRAAAGRETDDEIEILLPVVLKITHLVIDAESDAPLRHMLSEKRRRAQEVEDDPPAGDLGVVVATAVVVPRVAMLVCHMG